MPSSKIVQTTTGLLVVLICVAVAVAAEQPKSWMLWANPGSSGLVGATKDFAFFTTVSRFGTKTYAVNNSNGAIVYGVSAVTSPVSSDTITVVVVKNPPYYIDLSVMGLDPTTLRELWSRKLSLSSNSGMMPRLEISQDQSTVVLSTPGGTSDETEVLVLDTATGNVTLSTTLPFLTTVVAPVGRRIIYKRSSWRQGIAEVGSISDPAVANGANWTQKLVPCGFVENAYPAGRFQHQDNTFVVCNGTDFAAFTSEGDMIFPSLGRNASHCINMSKDDIYPPTWVISSGIFVLNSGRDQSLGGRLDICAYSIKTGAELWYLPKRGVAYQMYTQNHDVLVMDRYGERMITSLDLTTGVENWHWGTPSPMVQEGPVPRPGVLNQFYVREQSMVALMQIDP